MEFNEETWNPETNASVYRKLVARISRYNTVWVSIYRHKLNNYGPNVRQIGLVLRFNERTETQFCFVVNKALSFTDPGNAMYLHCTRRGKKLMDSVCVQKIYIDDDMKKKTLIGWVDDDVLCWWGNRCRDAVTHALDALQARGLEGPGLCAVQDRGLEVTNGDSKNYDRRSKFVIPF